MYAPRPGVADGADHLPGQLALVAYARQHRVGRIQVLGLSANCRLTPGRAIQCVGDVREEDRLLDYELLLVESVQPYDVRGDARVEVIIKDPAAAPYGALTLLIRGPRDAESRREVQLVLEVRLKLV